MNFRFRRVQNKVQSTQIKQKEENISEWFVHDRCVCDFRSKRLMSSGGRKSLKTGNEIIFTQTKGSNRLLQYIFLPCK